MSRAAQIAALADGTLTAREIAERLRCSKTHVLKTCQRHGLRPRQVNQRLTTPVPGSLAAQVTALAASGALSAREIAERVGSTIGAVQKTCYRYGISLIPAGRPRASLTPHRRAMQAAQNARRRVGPAQPGLHPRSAPVVPLTVRWRCCAHLVIGPVPCPDCGTAPAWATEVAA